MEMNKFRTQLGGFHRGDVANYIEKTAREHQLELQKMQEDCAKLTAERDILKKALEDVKAQLEAALEGRELPEIPEGDPETLELAAYRRAEAAERKAAERIRRQTEKMDGILEGMAGEFETAKADVQDMAGKLCLVLDALQGGFEKATAEMEQLKQDTEE